MNPEQPTAPVPESVTGGNELTYLWMQRRWPVILSVGAAVAVAVTAVGVGFGGPFFIVPFMVIVAWFGYAHNALQRRLMQQYAQLHGYSFSDALSDYQPTGAIFNRGHGQKTYDVVAGVLPGSQRFYLYLYKFTVGYGRGSTTYNSTAVSIMLPESGPHLYLASKHGSLRQTITGSEIAGTFQSSKSYQLEGDFNNYYELYGENGDEINLLEVVNPAIMQRLLTIASYDIELLGNVLNLYRSSQPDSASELDNVLAVAQELIAAFGPIMHRMDTAAGTQV